MSPMQMITPFLWFNDQTEEAVTFYALIFKRSKIKTSTCYGDAGPGPKGSVMTASIVIEGQEFVSLNSGPIFTFTPAISFVVNCRTQAEVGRLWTRLSEGGEPGQCGWLKDKYGVSWQIILTNLTRLLTDRDPVKANSVMQAMLKMNKVDIAALKAAYGSAK